MGGLLLHAYLMPNESSDHGECFVSQGSEIPERKELERRTIQADLEFRFILERKCTHVLDEIVFH